MKIAPSQATPSTARWLARFLVLALTLLLTVAPASSPGQSAGSPDPGFNPEIAFADPTRGSAVYALAVQADGSILVGGTFDRVNGTARTGLARLRPDGSLDEGFNPVLGGGAIVRVLDVQTDGRVIVAGEFRAVNGVGRVALARLNADGSLDPGFVVGGLEGAVHTVALQPDGQLVLPGTFFIYGRPPSSPLVRLNADGSLDPTLRASIGGSGLIGVNKVTVQADGKILVGGSFSQVSGVPRADLARLNADGSLDEGFNVTSNDLINTAVLLSDGRIGLLGSFRLINGQPRPGLARVQADGSLNPNSWGADFYPGGNGPNAPGAVLLVAQPGGRALIGDYLPSNPSGYTLSRIGVDGGLEGGFRTLADGVVSTVVTQADGRLLLGGTFSQVNGVSHARLARVLGERNGPVPVVSVVGAGATRGGFVVSRADGAPDEQLVVHYHHGGSAVAARDYRTLSGTVTIEPGQNEALIPVTPLIGANRNRKVKVFLDADPDGPYRIGKAQSKVFLSDLP